MNLELLAFVVLAVLALVSAAVVVFHRTPVVCALALAFNLVAIAGFVFLLHAQFIGFLQIMVYAGAIIVLVFASIASLHWVGIVAVLAMSIGTAITVSIMAFFVGTVRENLDRLSWVNGRYAAYIVDIIAISGGIVILMIGITLISSSFLPQHPLVGM